MNAGDLTTLDNLKAWLNNTTTKDDILLARLISAASAFIATWTDRQLCQASYTEIRNGNGHTRIMLQNYPVRAVSRVLINGQEVPAATAWNTPGYRFDDTTLYLNGYAFVRGIQNIEIDYTGGYNPVPADIEQACIDLVAWKYRAKGREGKTTESTTGQLTAAFSQRDLPPTVQPVLDQYKRVAYFP